MSSTTARAGADAAGTARRLARLASSQTAAAWLLALPFVALFLVFTRGPVLASFGMSFTDIRSADLRTPLAVNAVALDNYLQLLSDPVFRKVAGNTALYVLFGVPLTMAAALAAAVGLNGIARLRAFFRTGYYLPVVTSIVAVSVVWRFMLVPDGLINTVLGWFGVPGADWLSSTTFALPALIVMATWRNLGTLMVIFLAGLQAVPDDVIEAADVDGAGRWARLRHVTVPMLRPTLLFGAVITGIGYLQFFEEAFVMTKGGPLDATRSVSFYTYDQFGFGNYGYAAAMSWVLFMAIVLLTIAQFRLLRTED
ncbi:MAG TPA: sugar ABC transporter permease [Euzebyales bacterium]|nr:sugar ABC transporter permease [Euzebyales bacterium]